MEELESDLLEGFIALGVEFGGLGEVLLVEQVVRVVATGEGSLLAVLASLQRLLELLPPQVVPPGVRVLALQVGHVQRRLLGVHKQPVLPQVTADRHERRAVLARERRAVDYLPRDLREHGYVPRVHVHYVELRDCKRMRQNVLHQVISFFLQVGGALQGFLLYYKILLVLIVGRIVESKFVHPAKTPYMTFILVTFRG